MRAGPQTRANADGPPATAPTGAAHRDQAGTRPSRVVRYHRRLWARTRRLFQRGRGCGAASTGPSAAQRIVSSFSLASSSTTMRWARNMFSLGRRWRPLSQTSARVASPPSSSDHGPGSEPPGKRQRNHQSRPSRTDSSSTPQLQRPAARSAPAAVPGTVAPSQSDPGRGSLSGAAASPGDRSMHSHAIPASRSPAIGPLDHAAPRGVRLGRPEDGRGWFRTSDLSRVRRALSR